MSSTVKAVTFADRPQTAAPAQQKHKKFSSGTMNHVQAKLVVSNIPIPTEKAKLSPSKITTPPPTARPQSPSTVPKEDS